MLGFLFAGGGGKSLSERAVTFVGLSAPPIFMAIATVVNITDADWHDPSGNATMTTLKPAYAATKAKSARAHASRHEGFSASRQSWMRFQKSSVNFSISCGGKIAVTFCRTASFASSVAKKSHAI